MSVCFVGLSGATTDGSVDVRDGVLNEFAETPQTREKQSGTEQGISEERSVDESDVSGV